MCMKCWPTVPVKGDFLQNYCQIQSLKCTKSLSVWFDVKWFFVGKLTDSNFYVMVVGTRRYKSYLFDWSYERLWTCICPRSSIFTFVRIIVLKCCGTLSKEEKGFWNIWHNFISAYLKGKCWVFVFKYVWKANGQYL